MAVFKEDQWGSANNPAMDNQLYPLEKVFGYSNI
jgi:hypothetical protein